MILIGLLLGLSVVGGIVGWPYYPRTRKIVVVDLVLILGLAVFVALASLIQIYLFPLPPL